MRSVLLLALLVVVCCCYCFPAASATAVASEARGSNNQEGVDGRTQVRPIVARVGVPTGVLQPSSDSGRRGKTIPTPANNANNGRSEPKMTKPTEVPPAPKGQGKKLASTTLRLSPAVADAAYKSFTRTHGASAVTTSRAQFDQNRREIVRMNDRMKQLSFSSQGPYADVAPASFKASKLNTKNPRKYRGKASLSASFYNNGRSSSASTSTPSDASSKSKSVPVARGNRRSFVQIHSSHANPNARAGGVAGVAGGKGTKSGKTAGDSGGKATKSGKIGGSGGGSATKSGKTGGSGGGSATKSGKTGGSGGGSATKSGKTGGTDLPLPPSGPSATAGTAANPFDFTDRSKYTAEGAPKQKAPEELKTLSWATDPKAPKDGSIVMRIGSTVIVANSSAPNGVTTLHGSSTEKPVLQFDSLPPGSALTANTFAENLAKYGVSAADIAQFKALFIRGKTIFTTAAFPQAKGCGSCWAHAVAKNLQQTFRKLFPKSTDFFSPQQILDCVKSSESQGCNGGVPMEAFEWLQKNPVATLAQYPIARKGGACKPAPAGAPIVSNGWEMVIPACTDAACLSQAKYEVQLVKYLKENAVMPLLYVHADAWQHYSGGIFDPALCSSSMEAGNHVVQIVGYQAGMDGGTPYYLIENTNWGKRWGWGGRILLPAGVNACGLANFVFTAKALTPEQVAAAAQSSIAASSSSGKVERYADAHAKPAF